MGNFGVDQKLNQATLVGQQRANRPSQISKLLDKSKPFNAVSISKCTMMIDYLYSVK